MSYTRLVFLIAIVVTVNVKSQQNYAQYVNPFIGTGGHGHTFPGPVMPFGMVQLSPDTRIDGSWDGCSGYHYSDSIIYGFSHTHLSGTGCSDWGDILLMPSTDLSAAEKKTYASVFSHKEESAKAGYYSVLLKKNNIKAELTVTPRVGIHRYTFPPSPVQSIVIDLEHRDKTLEHEMYILDSVTLAGYRVSEAWAKKQYIYFVIRFSQPFKNFNSFDNDKPIIDARRTKGNMQKAQISFARKNLQPLIVKVGISSVNTEGALRNLELEAPHWDFELYRKAAEDAWNSQLGKIEVSDNNPDKLAIFYTALYHCSIHPSLSSDVGGAYRGRDQKPHRTNGDDYYTVFSLWDTYRALHPLLSITDEKRSAHFLSTFLEQHRHCGRLPMWELSSNETDCMIGFHAVPVITDAMLKGIKGPDWPALYQAAKAASNYTGYGIPLFNKNGFLQVDDESESVSKSLEYAYDNWCIAQMAAQLNKPEEEMVYLKRSLAYLNLYDAATGHMRPRRNGDWLKPFVAGEINNHFTEGNSWQYSFYVPHDINGLINLHGGDKNFERKLDELFETKEKASGREQADVTGLIGQYAHGNEPSHHMIYLYNYCGRPQKTIALVNRICNEFYTNAPDGLIGNEDCGQMSAWYVFSALGMYPVCPGSNQYVLGKPQFSRIKINLENGKNFVIDSDPAEGLVSGVKLNGLESFNSFIYHSDIMNGGNLQFYADNKAGRPAYGLDKSTRPKSLMKEIPYLPAPLIESQRQVFKDTISFNIRQINSTVKFLPVFTVNGTEPGRGSTIFQQKSVSDTSFTLKAMYLTNQDVSAVTTARFYKLKYDYDIKILSTLNPQYAAEGAQTLVDGISGQTEWRKGYWLGVQGQDFTCTVDFKKPKTFSKITLNCLQDTPSWIVYPSQVKVFASSDNVKFVLIGTSVNKSPVNSELKQVQGFSIKSVSRLPYRYLKIVAVNSGKLPFWHPGAGGESYIFTDELEIK